MGEHYAPGSIFSGSILTFVSQHIHGKTTTLVFDALPARRAHELALFWTTARFVALSG